ncbi:Uncharacterised protein [Mycolicibacterium phlei]|uniref:hypothetical protein n=1 Tax=Mycobacteroides chelonae TaxID=1774 RepID=UPI000618B102|nr:hypothetical protein [Mycobacteroides chelonae]VEG17787.1 Uncharacterised protein [Mycolicibacterium phlei]AKC39446.1 hypothetical protein GR01_13985 [Mycobacteroides chelonae]ANA98910.1 hypothetical protein BB28_14820 [Mycobacteroides chelonae CCUG 47445]OLT72650.1 hypothetical protein BKG56_21915 [Mycobacteroides chelonae]ORV11978.1 hypothetical protein AWB96_21840 [Mycobacteroides chelonae]
MPYGRKDQHYVIDLCDAVLGLSASREHRFDWLRGDVSPKTGRAARLPVDGYWEPLALVVEYNERQHDEPVAHFDKPDRLTVSGVHRGEQRKRYDQRRRELLPQYGLRLVVISASDFETKRGQILRNSDSDIEVVRKLLQPVDA